MDNLASKILKALLMLAVVYWVFLLFTNPTNDIFYNLFGFFLMFLPLIGVVVGLSISKQWDGLKSKVGRSLIFVSLSLLMWFLGQSSYLFYSLRTGDVPFPGLPDYFFIFIDPFYAFALFWILKYSGAASNIKRSWAHLVLLVVPLFSVYLNYRIFFSGLDYFKNIDLQVTFELLYSFGSVAIMSLMVIVLVLSANKLGGKMKISLYYTFIGIIFQYVGDVVFSLIESSQNGYILLYNNKTGNGTSADLIYLISIGLIAVGLTKFDTKPLNNFKEQTNAIS